MQDMMKNFMGDMWKNVGDMGSMNMMKDVDPSKIGLQMLEMQKNAFNKTYNAMVQIQEQTEKMAEPLMKNNPVVPDQLKSMLKKSQEEMKKAIDDGFTKAEAFFSPSNNNEKKAKPSAAEASKEKAEPKAK